MNRVAWNKGKKMSEEYKEKISLAHKGKKHSEETKKKMSKSHKGLNTWAKGRKLPKGVKEKISKNHSRYWLNKELPYDVWNKGKPHNKIRGKNHWNWKGDKYKDKQKSLEYKNWRRFIFIRDEFTCKECGVKNIYIEAHHIKSWRNYPKLRFDMNNGITLCKSCHKKTNNYGEKSRKEINQR